MYAFVMERQPKSHQAKYRDRYMNEIVAAFDNQMFPDMPLSGSLYARVYYFHTGPTAMDADNMSKPVVDALKGHAYDDDNIVIHRTAAIIDMGDGSVLPDLNLTNTPDMAYKNLRIALDNNAPDVLYIEIGMYSDDMLHFGGG